MVKLFMYHKGVPNMIIVKVICYVNVENYFLTFTMHITFRDHVRHTLMYDHLNI